MSFINRGPTRALIAIIATALVTGATPLIGAPVAGAHAALLSSDPANNAELTQPPARVSATFNEDMQPRFAAMTVIGADGNNWATGDPQVDGAVISIGVKPLTQSGSYTVNYRATSADGHVVTGAWSFRLTVPAATTAGASAQPTATPAAEPAGKSSSGGIPLWPFYTGAVLIVAAGAVWAVRRRT